MYEGERGLRERARERARERGTRETMEPRGGGLKSERANSVRTRRARMRENRARRASDRARRERERGQISYTFTMKGALRERLA